MNKIFFLSPIFSALFLTFLLVFFSFFSALSGVQLGELEKNTQLISNIVSGVLKITPLFFVLAYVLSWIYFVVFLGLLYLLARFVYFGTEKNTMQVLSLMVGLTVGSIVFATGFYFKYSLVLSIVWSLFAAFGLLLSTVAYFYFKEQK